ncbi:MAG: DUF1501 domain-containing protein [Pseudomonadota bacterium]|nr:DUF1501 domain-containing protein [Pseudomonadota bacterium]
MISRRSVLRSGATGFAGLGLAGLGLATLGLSPRAAHAAVSSAKSGASDTKFVFVFAPGGWDPTRVFADEFSNGAVDMEAGAERGTAGNIGFVDHAERPSVRTFLEAWHARTVVLNGLMVRSIAHEICTMIAMTGTTSGLTPDWPAILAAVDRDRFTLPHLVLGGPSFPGDLGVAVSRTGSNGQLEALLSGRSRTMADVVTGGPNAPAESLMDRYLSRRAAARAAGSRSAVDAALAAQFKVAVDHAAELKDLQYIMDFTGGTDVADQVQVAVDALSLGVSRCVTLASAGAVLGWDTHADNDNQQSPLWETLFSGLGQLMQALASTPGTSEATLADETVVVVLSEMGRTPKLNAFNGKDHWPYTSAMIVGPNLVGDRVIGGFDRSFYGKSIDTVTGDVDEGGQVLSAEALGATLLAIADVDPREYVDGVDPIMGMLA